MTDTMFDDRRAALENAFFARQDETLRRRLAAAGDAERDKAAFAAASGIGDAAILDTLAGLHIGAETLAAFSLVPLVAVAWADGSIDDKERAAMLSCAADLGLTKGDASYRLFDSWLASPPAPDLLAAWKAYVGAFAPTLTAEARDSLKDDVLRRARAVAEAAGGFLTLGRISAAEARMLEELESAFAD